MYKQLLSLGMFFFLFAADAAWATTRNVPQNYPTIQRAISAAVKGDTVLVSPGTYAENIDFNGKAITVMSEQGPEVTVIDGSNSGSVVTFNNLCQQDSVLDGFTITNGNFSSGGGVRCWDFASPTIRNNIITGNTANSGGGIWCSMFKSVITHNIIMENTASFSGGGIYCSTLNTGTAEVSNNIIKKNSAGTVYGLGGGIYCGDGSPALINNMITDNIAANGGGIAVVEYGVLMTNNTVANNIATVRGGGVYCDWCTGSITNMILWNNTAPSNPEIYYWNTSPTVSYCNVKGGWPGNGNIDADPLFVDEVDGDFHLTYSSPCRDTGDNTVVTELFDFEGDPRIAYDTVDMGADEFYTHLYWTGDATPGGNVTLKFVGIPGTFPVQLWLGSVIMDPPMQTKYGDWYLKFPVFLGVTLGTIPGPDGVLTLPATLPPTTPTPLSLPLQAGIGVELTNLSVMEVQ